MKKLCNRKNIFFINLINIFKFSKCFFFKDPELIYDKCANKEPGFENALSLYPSNFNRKLVISWETQSLITSL